MLEWFQWMHTWCICVCIKNEQMHFIDIRYLDANLPEGKVRDFIQTMFHCFIHQLKSAFVCIKSNAYICNRAGRFAIRHTERRNSWNVMWDWFFVYHMNLAMVLYKLYPLSYNQFTQYGLQVYSRIIQKLCFETCFRSEFFFTIFWKQWTHVPCENIRFWSHRKVLIICS